MSREHHLEHELATFDADLGLEIDVNQKITWTTNLVEELMFTLEMKPLGALEIYDAVDEAAPGWSFIQPITTSHIAGHYFSAPGPKPHLHLDIYSCKSFDIHAVVFMLKRRIKIHKWAAVKIIRKWNNGTTPQVQIYGES